MYVPVIVEDGICVCRGSRHELLALIGKTLVCPECMGRALAMCRLKDIEHGGT